MNETPSRTERFIRAVDTLSDRTGILTFWLLLVMILVAVVNTMTRYVDRWVEAHLGSNAYIEFQWYLFGAIFLLGGAHTLRRDAHVRVDVLYDRLGWRARAWINLLGHVFFLLPVCLLVIWMCWGPVLASWREAEMSPDPGGLPRYWIKSVIPLGFGLLALQAVAEVARGIQSLRRGAPEPIPSAETPSTAAGEDHW